MATIAATVEPLDVHTNNSKGCILISWDALTNGDEGAAVEMGAFADRSVQVVGDFGAGGSCAIEGSNDGVNYSVLTDPQGNALNIATSKIEVISKLVRYNRPSVTGDVTTSLTVTMMLRRA